MASECKNITSLRRFFHPRGIAVVGASADPIKPGGRIVTLLRDFQFPGGIFPVNPGRKEVQGLPCFKTLAEIKDKVDLVVISVAAEQVPGAVGECVRLGLHNILVISAGFAEVGPEGAALQSQLKTLVDEHGLNLLGPNCLGFVNALQPAAASFSLYVDSGKLRRGPVGFIAQSGGLGVLALYLADREELGFSYMINTGNETGLDFASMVSFLAREPEVKVIGGYLEGTANGEGLRRSLREAAEAGKPVVLLKAGDSQEAVEAISSHTGALAGSREAYRAVFRQEGVLQVSTMTEMISLLKSFAPGRLLAGNRVGIFSLSGGMGVLAADLCAAMGLELARFSEKTAAGLRQLMPSIATVRNPLDPTAAIAANLEGIRASLDIILADPAVDLLIFATAFWRLFGTAAAEMLIELSERSDKPVLIVWPGCGPEIRSKIQGQGLPLYSELKEGFAAAAALWRYASFQKSRLQPAPDAGSAPEKNRQQVKALIANVSDKPNLTEIEAKEILKMWGLHVPRGFPVQSADDAAQAAHEIGYPVALKVVSRSIIHKTEAEGVALGITGESQLRLAWARMRERLTEKAPEGAPQEFLVEEMLPAQLELMIGARRDEVFGPLLVFSPGGIFVELFQDLSMRPAPVSPGQAREMIGELKSAPLLQGFRGSKPADINRLAETMAGFSRLAWELKDQFREMEINPLIICKDGRIAAADALFIR